MRAGHSRVVFVRRHLLIFTVVVAAMLAPSTTLPGFSSTGQAQSEAPDGFSEITGTDKGREKAAEASERAHENGRSGDPEDFRVFERSDRGGGEVLTVHRAVDVREVAISEQPDGTNRAEVVGDLSDESVKRWRERSAATPPSSAHAAESDQTTPNGGTGGGGSCYDLAYSSNWVEFQSCWGVTYDGYASDYYYYIIEQDIDAKSKAYSGFGSWLIDMDIQATRQYGTSWAGTNSKSPPQAVTRSCDPYTLSVSYAGFGVSKGTQVCETWTPDFNSTADFYSLDWNGTVGWGTWRHMDYLLLQRRYRDPSWKFTFYAAVNWTT